MQITKENIVEMIEALSVRIERAEKGRLFEPLEKEISVADMQKIVDANEKLVKELKDGKSSNCL